MTSPDVIIICTQISRWNSKKDGRSSTFTSFLIWVQRFSLSFFRCISATQCPCISEGSSHASGCFLKPWLGVLSSSKSWGERGCLAKSQHWTGCHKNNSRQLETQMSTVTLLIFRGWLYSRPSVRDQVFRVHMTIFFHYMTFWHFVMRKLSYYEGLGETGQIWRWKFHQDQRPSVQTPSLLSCPSNGKSSQDKT